MANADFGKTPITNVIDQLISKPEPEQRAKKPVTQEEEIDDNNNQEEDDPDDEILEEEIPEDDEDDFGSGDEDDVEEEDDILDPDTHEVVVNGEKVAVTLEDLKKNFSGNKFTDVQLQKASEARKAAESVAEELKGSSTEYLSRLEFIETVVKGLAPKEPEWEKLRREDPEQYNIQLADWNSTVQKLQSVSAEKQEEIKRIKERNEKLQEESIKEQYSLAIQKIPELSDREKAGALTSKWRDLVKSYGFSDEEYSGISDHRLLKILHDFSSMKEAFDGRKKKLNRNRQRINRHGVRPNSSSNRQAQRKNARQSDEVAARKKAMESGKPDDVAALLIQRKRER